MKNINFGVAKKNVLKETINYFIDNEKINETTTKFFEVVCNSPILSIEFEVYKNIEENYIDNDSLASKYIDNNIKLLEGFDFDQITEEHNKLEEFINENVVIENFALYNNINTLITTNDVNKIHEAYSGVLNYLKTNKSLPNSDDKESILSENIDLSLVIDIAVEKFNKKYTALTEADVKILNVIIEKNINEQKEIFESLKNDNLSLLTEVNNTTGIEDKINLSLDKVNKMQFNNQNFIDDVIKLQNLKNSLS